ncbi:MAG TPA: NAD(P)-dependent oxidoreductase [Bacteroidales bacterium]
MKTKNIWILGGTGFIGSALVRHLSENPKNSLHLLVHRNVPYRSLESHNTFTGSLENFDLAWMEKYSPDVIFHLARLGGSNAFTRNLSSYKGAKANYRLIRCLESMKKPPTLVYVSGSLMYGHQTSGNPIDEYASLSPVSYAKYYIRGEEPWIEAQTKASLDIRFARPGWILGPASWFRIFYWQHYVKTGKIPLFGDGQQRMSLIHVDDCAGQIANLAEKGSKLQNLNIFSGPPVTQEIFAETLASLLQTQTETISVKTLKNEFGNTVTEALTSSIPLQTKYCEMASIYIPKYPDLEAMLVKTLSALKHHEAVFSKTP